MNLVWTEQLSVGNKFIDSEHKKLMDLVNDLAHMAQAGDHSALPRAFKSLKDCISRHFANEELFAHALGFPFPLHKIAHQNLLSELDFTSQEIKKGSAAVMHAMGSYAQFLRDWLIKHIREEDLLMRPVLQTRPYDFKIGGINLPEDS